MIHLETCKDRKNRAQIKKLYLEAFPAKERMPFFLFHLKKKGQADLSGVYEKGKLAGMVYCVRHKNMVFIFYLAVEKSLRGRGYGSRILEKLKEKYRDCSLVLNMEEVDPSYENYEQRKKRKDFYRKNGFRESGFKIREYGVIYEFMYYGQNTTVREYQELLRNYFGKFLYGLYRKNSAVVKQEKEDVRREH